MGRFILLIFGGLWGSALALAELDPNLYGPSVKNTEPVPYNAGATRVEFQGDIKIELDVGEGETDELLTSTDYYKKKSLQIFFGTNTNPIAKEAKGSEDSEIERVTSKKQTKYFWKVSNTTAGARVVSDEGNLSVFTISNLVIQGSDGGALPYDGSGNLKIVFGFATEGKVTPDNDVFITVQKLGGFPKVAPTEVKVSSLAFAGKVSWKNNDQISRYGESKTGSSRVAVMVFRDDFDGEINVKYFTKKDPEEAKPADLTSGKCSFDKATKNIDCAAISYDKEKQGLYVESSQETSSTFKFALVDLGKSEYVFGDLLPGNEYFVVLQYEEGLERVSSSDSIIPVETIGLGGRHELGDPRCFIVSAAFGSPFAKHVAIFRWFRDTILMSTEVGKNLMQFYYDHSQPYANSIRNSVVIQSVTKVFLWPLAGFLYVFQFVFKLSWWVLLGFIGAFFIGYLLFLKRRRICD